MPDEAGTMEGSVAFDGSVAFTDSHAHLSLVESRLGKEVVDALLSTFSSAWTSVGGVIDADSDALSRAPFIMDIGIRPGDLSPRIDRFGAYPFVRFSAGLWPGGESLDKPREALKSLEKDLGSPRCVALGECGLDYHHMEAPRSEQIALFEAQAAIAVERALPLIVHSREAFEDTLAVVSNVSSRIPVIIHCFSYGASSAKRFIEAGCFLSFAGNITYKNSEELRRALQATPADRLLMETDSPYMNPMPSRGKPSTSLDIGRTIARAALLKEMSDEALAASAQANAFRIFSGGGDRSAGERR